MKIYISADIEGVTGVTHWDETSKNKSDYSAYSQQMTDEVGAACDGCNDEGAESILIKDAHESGRNIDHSQLPKNSKLIRGWDGGLYSMVQDLDDSFDGIVFIGYHSGASIDGSPLSHTLTPSVLSIKLNGELVDEFLLHAYIAAYHKVPILFISGDRSLCESVKKLNPSIETVAVKEGKGDSTISIHPEMALELIREGVSKSLKKDKQDLILNLPEKFLVEVQYPKHMDALRNSNYPGAKLKDSRTVTFSTNYYIEVLRFIHFTV